MAGNRSPTILVTDANRGTAVTIIRSLGRAGRDVVAADSNPGAIGFSSRYTSHKFVYPDPKTEPERFIETLLENVKRYSIDLILPVTDDVLQPLINASELFAGVCTLGVPEKKAYEIVTDKSQTLELADKLGIPTPVTRRVETLEDLDKISDQLEFPLVVKPESSVKLCSNGEYRSFSVCYAEDMASLRKTMVELGGNIAVLLQEYTAGAGCGIDIVANKGECLCVFEHQRLAEVPITGGASAWRESVDPDPVLVSHAKRLVAELEWTGPIMVEFKVGKKISLMEINGRVWGSMPLASAAGVDFPGIWAEIYLGEQDPVAEQCSYPLGVRTYNLELMSTWIINVMLGRTRYPYLPHPRRWEAFKGLFAVFSGSSHSDLMSRDDPVPAQLQRRGLLGRLSSKVRSELFPGKSGPGHSRSKTYGVDSGGPCNTGKHSSLDRILAPLDAHTHEINLKEYLDVPESCSTPVVILHAGRTGLAAARCLAMHGVEVYVASFDAADVCMHSRLFSTIDLSEIRDDVKAISRWLSDFSSRLSVPPVVIPVSDKMVLMLSMFRAQLSGTCNYSTTSYEDLESIVSKDKLYTIADQLGVPVPPMVIAPSLEELVSWCRENEAPYFVKPYYMMIDGCSLLEKNLIFPSDAQLIDYIKEYGSKNLIIQRFINSGDGHVFDCYGYCDRDGKIVTMASHKRIRQNPPHRGITSFGEIPAEPRAGENALFRNTIKLLGGLNYHGIFGIEWIEDKATGDLILVDFNARPFSSVGHLRDCGLNLPYLAYLELTGSNASRFPLIPVLDHKYWLDLRGELRGYYSRRKEDGPGFFSWLASISRSRSFAYFSLHDLRPAVYVALQSVVRFFELIIGISKK